MATSQLTAPVLQALQDGTLAGNWTLDPAGSQVRLRSKSLWGMVSVKGVFGQVAGAGVITRGGEVSGTLTVGAASLDTRNNKRDDHLRSADFFDADRYPEITVEVTGIEPSAGDAANLYATFTIKGVTAPVSLPVEVGALGGAVRVTAKTQVDRYQFGIDWNQLGMVAKTATVTAEAYFVRTPQ